MKGMICILFVLTSLISCSTLPGKSMNDIQRARYFRERGDDVRAAVFYLRVLKRDGENREALSFLYNFYRERRDRLRAFEVLLRLLEIDGENPLWHFEAAKMLVEDGDVEDGCREYHLALHYGVKRFIDDTRLKIFKRLKEECEK